VFHPRVIVGWTVRSLLIAGITGLFTTGPALAAFAVPPNDGFVTDTAGLLTPAQKQSIEADLTAYRKTTSNEIAVVIIKSLDGTPIEDAGLQIGRKWGIGSDSKNNGILILVAYDDHEVRLEVGYGLEGAVPDIVAQGIIDTDITPLFRQGDYAGGISAAINSLEKHIGGEYTADRYANKSTGAGFGSYLVFLLFIVFQGLLAVMARTKSWWLGGAFGGIAGIILTALYGWWLSIPFFVVLGLIIDYFVSKNPPRRGRRGGGWWIGGGGFGGGQSGGSGFGGFGGGSFGGGGASGKW
jgi:uncharacterized protein